MSIASDLRAYADDALEQGKKVVDSVVEQARRRPATPRRSSTTSPGQANDFVGKLTDTAKDNVTGLRQSATATRPTCARRPRRRSTWRHPPRRRAVRRAGPRLRRDVSATITEQAEKVLATARKDKRVATLLDSAESVTGAVVETVQERVVAAGAAAARQRPEAPGRTTQASPTQAGRRKPATAKPATKPTRKPAGQGVRGCEADRSRRPSRPRPAPAAPPRRPATEGLTRPPPMPRPAPPDGASVSVPSVRFRL